MNQSKTKFKTTLLIIGAICFMALLIVVGFVEVRYYNKYTNQISQQEDRLRGLENYKNYYNSNNERENSLRDDGYANDGDIVFGEE